jgi:hypothetical protein
MYQAYRSDIGCWADKTWLPFTGDTEAACRQSAVSGGLTDFDLVYIAQVDQEVEGVQPVPADAKFAGKF